jgi:adenine-specific DNA-methyltransferase
VSALKNRTRFGLVYERHLPETVVVGDTDGLRIGDHVRPRKYAENDEDYRLVDFDGDRVTILSSKTGEQREACLSDLLIVRRFGDPADVALTSVGSIVRSDGRPYHVVIDGENFHALQLLTFVHEGEVDCIYIDPPYNTGARDWTYNNHFVDSNDAYRHSKWLSFMEKRLRLARRLLKRDGVLIVTIDEHEVHHLGMLVEELFPGSYRQMISMVTNPKGVTQERFSRVEEYALFCFLGNAAVTSIGDDLLTPIADEEDDAAGRPRWKGLLRSGTNARREDRKNMFYPVLIDPKRDAVLDVGEPLLPIEKQPDFKKKINGLTPAWPVKRDGSLGNWGVGAKTLKTLIQNGYVSLGPYDHKRRTWGLSYLARTAQNKSLPASSTLSLATRTEMW